ncbi:MarR family winged helix-turn-helix transcriptional regulator [Pelotomaculum propionicicum]|uniref:MarR family winged helix-turn-helix transcriptional regulator n=1 Tax=Pelotomaculum propionicicum TaxID=258475 RepID=UPI003B7A9F05
MIEEYLKNCLYFTASKLARIITKMAEEEFAPTGLSPAYAFLLMIVHERPGISQQELGSALHLTPSTVTRFIDKLEVKGFVTRTVEGKNSLINLTEKGLVLQERIEQAWSSLYDRYSDILGEEEGDSLTKLIFDAGERLDGK